MATNSEPKTEVPIVDCFVEYQSNHIPKIYYDLYNGIGRVKCQCGVMPELQVIHNNAQIIMQTDRHCSQTFDLILFIFFLCLVQLHKDLICLLL